MQALRALGVKARSHSPHPFDPFCSGAPLLLSQPALPQCPTAKVIELFELPGVVDFAEIFGEFPPEAGAIHQVRVES